MIVNLKFRSYKDISVNNNFFNLCEFVIRLESVPFSILLVEIFIIKISPIFFFRLL